MRIIITGSTGFVGRHLIPKILDKGHDILEITIEPKVSEKMFGSKTTRYTITEDQEIFRKRLKDFNPEIAIHLASFLTSEDDYSALLKLINTNVLFFCRLLDALKMTNLELFVNTGTFAEYNKGDGVLDPAYLYSSTKTASRFFLDYYSKVYDFKQITVVPYTIYGGNYDQKKIMDIIYDSINMKNPADLSPGEQILDFIHIDDVSDFYLAIIENYKKIMNKTNFHLGTGVGTTLKQVAKLMEQITNSKTNINWGAKPYRPSDVMYAIAETSYIDFWKPSINLIDGIKLYLNNIKSESNQHVS